MHILNPYSVINEVLQVNTRIIKISKTELGTKTRST